MHEFQDYQYKRYINLDQNCRLYQLDTKNVAYDFELSREKALYQPQYRRSFFQRTNAPDNLKNRENWKLTKTQPYFLKLYINSGPNKPNKVIR